MAFPSANPSGSIFSPYEAWKLERLPQPSLMVLLLLSELELELLVLVD